MADVETDDSSLVRRASGGDGDALEQLVQRHQAWVYNVTLRMSHTRMTRRMRPRKSSSRR